MDAETIEILDLCKQGDFDAFGRLLRRYEKMVYNLGMRLLGRPTEAEEILQETFLQVHKALPRFEGAKGLASWIYTIALNQSRMRLRKQKGVVMQELEETVELHTMVPGPTDLLLDKELRELMEEAIQELPEPNRVVFVLREMEGKSTEETAGLLDLTEAAVKSRLHRARLFLREKLCEYYEPA